jgi:membrane protein YqaA with SNARE-associated domain
LEILTGWISSDLSLWGLFTASFMAATLLPGGSEAIFLGVLNAYPENLWPALAIAAIGNTLGGMVTFGMGWMLPHTRQPRHVDKVRKHGSPALLLAWVPLIGDALCLTAGWLRLDPWHSALFMAIGKLARYGAIAAAVSYPLSK